MKRERVPLRAAAVAAACVAMLGGCGASSEPSEPFDPPPERPLVSTEGRIAFVRITSQNGANIISEVYAICGL